MLSKAVLLSLAALFTAGSLSATVITIIPNSLSGEDGVAFNNAVLGTFSDTTGPDPLSNYSATVLWGDGTGAVLASIIYNSGFFTIIGSHTYAFVGSYTTTLHVQDSDTDSDTAQGSANIAGALSAPAGNTLSFTPGVALSNVTLGTFSDASSSSTSSDFTALISWGDSTSSPGTITGSSGSFSVSGSHTYAGPGNFNISVGISDLGGSSVTLSPVAETATPEPGSLGLALIGLASVFVPRVIHRRHLQY